MAIEKMHYVSKCFLTPNQSIFNKFKMAAVLEFIEIAYFEYVFIEYLNLNTGFTAYTFSNPDSW